jgi:predicted RNA-binding protein with PIN domain
MQLLIDGYNLLHATDLFGRGAAVGTLQGSREALLTFLARVLSDRERKQTTIVFDAAGAPPGLPAIVPWEGITARFARGFDDADALLEEIIEQHPAPKSLVVVSSDRRVQRAARHRGAKVKESQSWFDDLRERGTTGGGTEDARTTAIEDSSYWIKEFAASEEPSEDSPTQNRDAVENPFPPGYGDDLLSAE